MFLHQANLLAVYDACLGQQEWIVFGRVIVHGFQLNTMRVGFSIESFIGCVLGIDDHDPTKDG